MTIAVVAVAVLAFPTAASAAMSTMSLKSTEVENGFEASGSNVIWFTDAVDEPTGSSIVRIMRQSLGSSTPATVFGTDPAIYEEIHNFLIAGDFVAVEVESQINWSPPTRSTRVVRMRIDGSEQVVIATGTRAKGSELVPKTSQLSDCGSQVWLEDLSASGEVALGQLTARRMGPGCDDTENVNSWSYSTYRSAGDNRMITSHIVSPRLARRHWNGQSWIFCDCDAGRRTVRLNGDWAMIARPTLGHRTVGHALVNLTAGARSHAYTRINQPGYFGASFDGSGRVVIVNESRVLGPRRRGKRRKSKIVYRTFSYPRTASIDEAVRLPGDPNAAYCGSRLVGTSRRGRGTVLLEFDPITGVPVREITRVSARAKWSFSGCDADRAYLSRSGWDRTLVAFVDLN